MPDDGVITEATLCSALPLLVPSSFLVSFQTSESFEDDSALALWTLLPSGDSNAPIAELVCNGDGPPPGSNLAMTFTDTVNTADDGRCALRLRAGCNLAVRGDADGNGEVREGDINTIRRFFRVFDGGCGPNSSSFTSYMLRYSVAHETDVPCFVNTGAFPDSNAPDYLLDIYTPTPSLNNVAQVQIQVEFGRVLVVSSTFGVCDLDSRDWMEVSAPLRAPTPLVAPFGSTVMYTVMLSAANDPDSACDPADDTLLLIDNLRIVPMAEAAEDVTGSFSDPFLQMA